MCGAFERKENDFWKFKKVAYDHDLFIETLFWTNLCLEKS